MKRINITLDKLGDLGDSQLGTTLFVPLPSSAFLHLLRCESLRQGYTRVSGAYYHRWTHLTVVLAQGCSTQQPRWPQPEEYCTVPISWAPVRECGHWLRGLSGTLLESLLMFQLLLLWLPIALTGLTLIMWIFPSSASVHSLSQLMRPSTATSFSMPPTPTPGPEVWVSLQALPTLEIG